MAEPKPLASLTSGLLARKGAAQPAMRRPVIGFGKAPAASIYQDDLGWNDMGFDAPAPAAPVNDLGHVEALAPLSAPVVPSVITERQALEERVTKEIKPRQRAAESGRKAAFTLRLDPQRHLKLRLACAVAGRSAQQVVTQALDEYLNGLPEIDRLAQQLPHEGGK